MQGTAANIIACKNLCYLVLECNWLILQEVTGAVIVKQWTLSTLGTKVGQQYGEDRARNVTLPASLYQQPNKEWMSTKTRDSGQQSTRTLPASATLTMQLSELLDAQVPIHLGVHRDTRKPLRRRTQVINFPDLKKKRSS